MTQKSSKKSFQIITQNQWSPKPVELTTRDREGKKERASFRKSLLIAAGFAPPSLFISSGINFRSLAASRPSLPLPFSRSLARPWDMGQEKRGWEGGRRKDALRTRTKGGAVAWNMDYLLGYFRETRWYNIERIFLLLRFLLFISRR